MVNCEQVVFSSFSFACCTYIQQTYIHTCTGVSIPEGVLQSPIWCFLLQVISDFDEMKELIAKLHVSLDEEDDENEAFLER